MFQFTDDYKIGIPHLDEEHAYLVQLINESADLLNTDKTDIQEITENLIRQLKNYAATHFTHEEEYMMQINDPELPKQQKEHAAFLSKISEFTVDGSLKIQDTEELLQYLIRWLFNHILASDMMIGKIKPSKKENSFTFTDKYKIGIATIDQEHEALFFTIQKVDNLIHTELLHDKFDKIVEILNELKAYTEKHFLHEEEYMAKVNYPKLEAQKAAHAAFIEKLVNSHVWNPDSIDENQQQYLEELIIYLREWLSDHILRADRQIGEWIHLD